MVFTLKPFILKKLKQILFIALIIASKQPTFAQQNNLSNENHNVAVNETVFLHSNATTFVSGETLYYKLYCLNTANKMPSAVSKIAYVELIDSDKKSVFKSKLYLKNSYGQGDYFVSTTLKTGNYKLIGYTNWMLNQPVSEIFQMDILIINPFQSNGTGNISANASEAIPNSQSIKNEVSCENKNLKIDLDKKTFNNREQINLKIESLNQIPEKGNYSISIKKKDDLPNKTQINSCQFTQKPISTTIELINKEGTVILPELRGEMISGKITSKNGSDDIQNILVGLSIPGKSFAFKVVKTNQNGDFAFNLDKPYYSSNISIQIMDENRSNYSIILDDLSRIDYSKLSFDAPFNLSAQIKESLLDRSVASQIESAYYHKKRDSIAKESPINSFYDPIAKDYLLDDYTRFSTLKETSTEIVKEMYYQQKGNNYSLHLRDMSIYTQLPDPALVLVDGLLIQNVNELFDYNMKNIYKISVVPGLYHFGPKTFNGIINFKTKNNDYVSKSSNESSLKATISRPTIKKIYYKPDYLAATKDDRIPDFRNQLLWIPEITLDQKENQISFYSSDVTGTFEIALEGFTQSGSPVSLRETFEVK